MSTDQKKKSKIYKSNIIHFPNCEKNRQLDEHEQLIANLAFSIQQKMECNNFDKMELISEEIRMLSNYGETIKFAPDISARIISVLAKQYLTNSLMEDLIWVKKEEAIAPCLKSNS